MTADTISLLGGRLIDPANGVDRVCDLHLAAGRVAAIGPPPRGFAPKRIIDAAGRILCPGLIDLSARLREPGQEHKATIASETRAAASGGITSLCFPPDTNPVNDTPAVTELIRRKAKASAQCRVLPLGALTQGLQGEQLSEMAALKKAGCIAMSDGQRPMPNTLVLRRALEYSATFDLPVCLFAEDPWLRDQGCAHEGQVCARLGLPGIPEAAETVALARSLALATHTGARIHFHSLSSGASALMLAQARSQGLRVTADVAIHQLHLTEMDLEGFDSRCHVIPPLRTLGDREALRRAVAEGTIGAICSDHQPHEEDAKAAPFPSTAPGISGLETLLPLTLKLVEEKVLSLSEAIARLTIGPARILGIPHGQLAVGAPADIAIFDPQACWILEEGAMLSHGHNTPFLGWELCGRVTHTLVGGRMVFQRP